MYLSRFELILREKKSREILSDLYKMHQMVMGGFKSFSHTPIRVLFRLEPEIRDGRSTLLVQSAEEGEWSHLPPSIAYESKRFEPTLLKGCRYRFRLRANPVVTRKGKRYGLIGEEAQRAWLTRKDTGFKWLDFRIIDEGHLSMRKGNRPIHYKSVRYEGVLEVTDEREALDVLRQGIGPAKGFGFGLLSLARV